MPNSDPGEVFFYPTLTLVIDSYTPVTISLCLGAYKQEIALFLLDNDIII